LTATGLAIRTEIFDEAVARFLERHPAGRIVNLGAGLCTRSFRVDNERAHWINVDLPEMEELWRDVIGETERRIFVAASLVEPYWPERAGLLQASPPTLFVAEGVLMYLARQDAKSLLRRLAAVRPGAELIVETLGPLSWRLSRVHPGLAGTGARFRWGVRSTRALEGWVPGARVLEEWHYLERHPERWGRIAGLRRLPLARNEFKAGRLRFGA
jgi:O-methyltransferase involved in polyketide biosynthesis